MRLRRHDRTAVKHRFENHKNGQKSAWVVRKYRLRLLPNLYGISKSDCPFKKQLKWKRIWRGGFCEQRVIPSRVVHDMAETQEREIYTR